MGCACMWRWPGPGFSRKLQNLYGSRSPCHFSFLFSSLFPSDLSTTCDRGRYIFFPFFLLVMVLGERWSVAAVGSRCFLVALLKEGVIPEQLKLKDAPVFFSPPGNRRRICFLAHSPRYRTRSQNPRGEGERREGEKKKKEERVRRCYACSMQDSRFWWWELMIS